MKLRPILTWLQYAFANVVIVVLVPLLVLQGMPPIDWAWTWMNRANATAEKDEPPDDQADGFPPDKTLVANYLLWWTSPVTDVTGTWTGPWYMFAPDPDSTNHRIRADIEYYDGTVLQWRSPEWPELSCWQRFWSSRELEYVDNITLGTPDQWSAFADYLAAKHRRNPAPEGAPKKVRFVLEQATIARPNEEGWLPMSQPIPRDIEDVILPIRKYPLPPELRSAHKKPAAAHSPTVSAP